MRRNEDREVKQLSPPLTDEMLAPLHAGDMVLLTGSIFAARDVAHHRLWENLQKGKDIPVDLRGQIIYYTGPTPAPRGKPIGSCGPATCSRMDPFTPLLIERGLKATIGKGIRSKDVRESLKKFKAVYLSTWGGAGALLSHQVKKYEVAGYPELGPEAIYRLEVEDFPAVVINDIWGWDWYKEGTRIFRLKLG